MERRFGIELEVSEGNMNAARAALIAAGIDARVEFYNHTTRTWWKLTTDASVPYGFEVVSPILVGEEGIQEARKVAETLSAVPGVNVKVGAGFHVHMEASGWDIRKFRNIVKLWTKFERVFDTFVPASRRKDNLRWCRSVVSAIGGTNATEAAMFEKVDRCKTYAEIMSILGTRYLKLNLASYAKYGTVEFRAHSGTLNADKVEQWTRLCSMLMNGAETMRVTANKRELGVGELFSRLWWQFREAENRDALRAFFRSRQRALTA